MSVKHARPSLRPRRAALIAAVSALAVLGGGITGANALQGDGSSAEEVIAEPADFDSPALVVGDNQPTGFSSVEATAAARTALSTEAPLSGTGWKANGITSYRSTGYTIKFTDQRAVDWLGSYVRPLATHISEITGLRFTVDTAPVGEAYQQQAGEIMVNLYARPCKIVSGTGPEAKAVPVRDGSGAPGISCGYSWARGGSWALYTGEVWINAEKFDATGKPVTNTTNIKNLLAHEMGHALGLAHANLTPTANDCLKGADAGEQPVLCAPSALGYQDRAAGRYVQQYDLQGIRTLARNGGAHVPAQGPTIGIGGKCLDVRGGKSADGTQIQIWSCANADAQRWIANPDGTITAFGKCLDNYNGQAVNGNKIQLHSCNGTPAQKWRADEQGRLINVGTGMAVDVQGSSTANGTIVHLWTPHTGANQKWTLPRAAYAAS